MTIKNIGNLLASFTSIAISGPNASDFSKSNDLCATSVILQASQTCTMTINYSPSVVGPSQATLVVTDDALGSPQIISLFGTGVAPPPVVGLNPPGTLNFPGTTTQGTTSAAENITLTNTGNGPLHVTNITLSGLNSNDFIVGISNCLGTVAARASCIIPITFAPLAAGIRTTSLTITDDASTSPQLVTINGTAAPSVTPTGLTTASVTAGQTAQYHMQLTPGAGFSGTISLACSGAPLGAACQLPANISISNGAAAQFTVNVTTSGSAMLPPSVPTYVKPISRLRMFPLLAVTLVFLMTYKNFRIFENASTRGHLTMYGAFTVAIFCMFLTLTGCGGGNAAVAPQPIITPSGTSTITVTMSAMSSSGNPLQLQPIQLTLTVK